MPVAVPLIAGAATLGGAAIASSGSRRQANAAQDAAAQNNQLQQNIFNQQRADLAPWRASGEAALTEINRRLGLGGAAPAAAPNQGAGPVMGGGGQTLTPTMGGGGGGYGAGGASYDQRDTALMAPTMAMTADKGGMVPQAMGGVLSTDGATGPQVLPGQPGMANPTGVAPTTLPPAPGTAPAGANALDPENRYGGFYASPGYQFRFDEGQRGINANRAASGMMQSGDTLRALARYGQDYASNEYNTQMNQLFSVAGLGQTATGQGNALAGQYGAQVGMNNQNASNALRSSYGTQANAWGNALGNIGGNLAYNWPMGGSDKTGQGFGQKTMGGLFGGGVF
jgi:hypothetical protein